MDEFLKVLEVMHMAAYQLKGIVRIWIDYWKTNRVEGDHN